MGNANNPAGRLHALLTDYRGAAHIDSTMHATWASVLGVSEGQVPLALAEVAALIPDIHRLVVQCGAAEQLALFEAFARQWAVPMMSEHHPRQTPSPGPGAVDPNALAALGGLSAYLSTCAPEGVVPDAARVADLKAAVAELLEGLAGEDSLPPDLRSAINARLHDVLWAMDHVRIGGPGAVNQAMERLLGQITISLHNTPEARNSGFLKKVTNTVRCIWIAYKAGPQIHTALEGWQDILKQLPPGH
ncbi:hypothetical protein ACFWUU_02950 [Kribbella sp. NPDC058693]|uniref:hypothetical protein n=1 Tax=Kribbella sp. NPDC058693 TaxID=3346602 RepID=UPI003651D80B